VNKITRVYDYNNAQREQERALEMYRQMMSGVGGAAAVATPLTDPVVDEDVVMIDATPAPMPAPAPAPRPPTRPLPFGLQRGVADPARGALQMGPPRLASRAAAAAPRAASLAAVLAARAPPRMQHRPAAVQPYVPARAASQQHPVSATPSIAAGAPGGFRRAGGRRRASVVNAITEQELEELLPMGVAAWRAAYEHIYGQPSSSGNLVWLQQRLRDAVRHGDGDELEEED